MENGACVFDKTYRLSPLISIRTATATASILHSANAGLRQLWSAAPSFEAATVPGQFTRPKGCDMCLALSALGHFSTDPASLTLRFMSAPLQKADLEVAIVAATLMSTRP